MGVYLHEILPLIIISIVPFTKYLSLRSMETYASSSTSYLLTSAFIALLCRMAIIDIKITMAIIVVQTIIFVRAV